MGRKMVEFAQIIGTDQSTISKYESGKVPPSDTVLILLLLLARGDERAPLLKALGIGDDAEIQAIYQGAIDSLLEYDRLAARVRAKSEREGGLRKFVKEASSIAAAGVSLDPAVGEVLELIQVPEVGQKADCPHCEPQKALVSQTPSSSLQSNDEGARDPDKSGS
jgi:transcriptional regulator with XRE-family HTH domain